MVQLDANEVVELGQFGRREAWIIFRKLHQCVHGIIYVRENTFDYEIFEFLVLVRLDTSTTENILQPFSNVSNLDVTSR